MVACVSAVRSTAEASETLVSESFVDELLVVLDDPEEDLDLLLVVFVLVDPGEDLVAPVDDFRVVVLEERVADLVAPPVDELLAPDLAGESVLRLAGGSVGVSALASSSTSAWISDSGWVTSSDSV
jgi:hypothetical protein